AQVALRLQQANNGIRE
uniref:Uncharacterized protein n=1 Tax=Tetraodon nigroviridis TaxID=99883 RepID=H3C6M6_TETNG